MERFFRKVKSKRMSFGNFYDKDYIVEKSTITLKYNEIKLESKFPNAFYTNKR